MTTNELLTEIERLKDENERLKDENQKLKNEIIMLRRRIAQGHGITPGKPKSNQSNDIMQQSQNRHIGNRRIKL